MIINFINIISNILKDKNIYFKCNNKYANFYIHMIGCELVYHLDYNTHILYLIKKNIKKIKSMKNMKNNRLKKIKYIDYYFNILPNIFLMFDTYLIFKLKKLNYYNNKNNFILISPYYYIIITDNLCKCKYRLLNHTNIKKIKIIKRFNNYDKTILIINYYYTHYKIYKTYTKYENIYIKNINNIKNNKIYYY
jgi:hypothetical protein